MFGWIVGQMIRRAVRHLNAGDIGPMLSSYSRDAVLIFPGAHSWGGEYRGKSRIEEFLRRCVLAGLKFDVQGIVVSGWPWGANVCVRLTNQAVGQDGEVVYENRAIIYAEMAWGKIRYQEDYEDTQKVVAFDDYLETHRAPQPDA